ncbi:MULTISPECIES: flagellin N-terminal helical domain-containing protein [Bacillus cereus group]|uniref:flagellin N-terminal helical domain-containing protein n=1 Tax=Bacillus cereus group TaxID=86661 RepID=UPI000BF59D6A|nr:flagellin [Bacillus cereus]MEB8803204.1 flagellin [Bacillus cereus]NKX57847.1 flagellin [Bacillus cereus]PFD53273.1 flagellin [Bacillus cereus]PFH90349.1 flagellin [Bacillus cereus]PFK55907.1 flagellin [Bacillus cereus]
MRIGTNILSMNARHSLYENERRMNIAIERLATGKKLNTASDNPANVAIVTRMRARASGLRVAANNTQDGMSLIRTADSALNSVSNILLRMRDIANQSANGTNTGDNQKALDKEFAALKDQIDYISKNTEFNDKKLLNGDNKSIAIQTLDNADTTKQININLADSSTKALNINKLSIEGSGDQKITITADQLKDAKTEIDAVKAAKQGLADLKATATAPAVPSSPEETAAVEKFKETFEKVKGFMNDTDVKKVQDKIDAFEASKSVTTAQAIGTAFDDAAMLKAGEVTKKSSNASAAIKSIDSALETIASNRATLGATLNRLDFNVNNLKSQESSMASAASQIEDTDMAQEMSHFLKFKLLTEVALSMISQTNQIPQRVSKLLQS